MPDLWVRRHVSEQLRRLRGRPWEIGGWLLGYRDTEAVVITHATPPASRGTPFGVTISGRGHRTLFDRTWSATRGHVTFLGDWHTHPGGPPFPSRRDHAAVADVARDPDFKTRRPVIAIVATPRLPRRGLPALAFFEGDDGGHLTRLVYSLFDDLPDSAHAPEPWPLPDERE
jgi:integrative and conjugative element protein (TIGR02256 family)